MSAALPRRAALGAVLAAAAASAIPERVRAAGPALRSGGEPLPDHAALWARMPLPFTPAEAWHLLAPEVQAEIGAAVVGMVLSDYVSGDSHAEEDCFLDDELRRACRDARDETLGALDDRLWGLFPELYGVDDHPDWAFAAGMVLPIGAAPPQTADEADETDDIDPIFPAIEAADAARRAHQGIFDAGLDENDDGQMARLDALRDMDREAFRALAEVMPTTRDGDVALADFYLRTLDDPDGPATDALRHLRGVLAGEVA